MGITVTPQGQLAENQRLDRARHNQAAEPLVSMTVEPEDISPGAVQAIASRLDSDDNSENPWGQSHRQGGRTAVFDIVVRRPFVDPRAFGDGTDIDTGENDAAPALRRALLYAAEHGGTNCPLPIRLSPGVYKCKTPWSEASPTDESSPWGAGTLRHDRDTVQSMLPVASKNQHIFGDHGAILRQAIFEGVENRTANDDAALLSAVGRPGLVVEGIEFDGNIGGQSPRSLGATLSDFPEGMSVYYIFPGRAVYAPTMATIRDCRFYSWGGACPIPATSAWNEITGLWRQISFQLGESAVVTAGSYSLVTGNHLDGALGLGIILTGSFAQCANNYVANTGSHGISVWCPKPLLNDGSRGFLYADNPLRLYRGVRIGTVAALNQQYFGEGKTDSEVAGASSGNSSAPSNFDKSAHENWAVGNVIQGNRVEFQALDNIHLESALGTIVTGNTCRMGVMRFIIPQLENSMRIHTSREVDGVREDFPRTHFRWPTTNGINDTVLSIDTVIDGNDIFADSERVEFKTGFYARPHPLRTDGADYAVGQSIGSTDPAPLRHSVTIRGNTVFGGRHEATAGLPLRKDAFEFDNSFQSILTEVDQNLPHLQIQELRLDHEQTLLESIRERNVYGPSKFRCVTRAIDDATPTAQFEFAANCLRGTGDNYKGTKRSAVQRWLFRRDQDWRIDYSFRLYRRSADFSLARSGVIRFRYAETHVVRFEDEVSAIECGDGFIHIIPHFDEIFPGNITRVHATRTLPPMYRGGLEFVVATNETTLGLSGADVFACATDLVLEIAAEIREL